MKKALAVAFACGLIFVMAGISHAMTINGIEEIRHTGKVDNRTFVGVDLERTRNSSVTPAMIEYDDIIIRSENLVSDHFGVWPDLHKKPDVTFTHMLDWLGTLPSNGAFVFAELSIEAYGAQGGNDYVSIDSTQMGTLTDGGSQDLLTTIFTADAADLAAFDFTDGISVLVDKHYNTDHINVISSTFSFTYEYDDNSPTPVPEPATILLFGSGIAGMGALRKKKKLQK